MGAVNPVYFDSALIAKFYLNEPGQQEVCDLAQAAGKVVSSGVAIAEVAAAFHRKLREGAVPVTTFRALQGQFAHDCKSGLWTLIPVTDVILESIRGLFAGLAPNVYLRSLDALHLITARSEGFDRVHSNDRRLLDACPALGLVGANPVP